MKFSISSMNKPTLRETYLVAGSTDSIVKSAAIIIVAAAAMEVVATADDGSMSQLVEGFIAACTS